MQPTPNSGAPKAYLNWVVLDEAQLKLVSGNYGAMPIPTITSGIAKQLMQANNGNEISVTKNGYLYVFVSNESKGNVYFDDLLVEHIAGPLLEETHYYPFGLTMAGISSKAAGSLKNRKGYNGNELQSNEFSDNSGLELYDFNARTYDQQIGRFLQVDPLANEENQEQHTSYHFAFNNCIRYSDPDGKFPIIPIIRGIWTGYKLLDAAGMFRSSIKVSPYNSLKKISDATIVVQTKVVDKKFGGENDTNSSTRREAFRNAKDQNSIPRSQQPDKTIKPGTKEGDQAGLDKRNVKQDEFTNSKGEKVIIREDKPANYPDGGSQPPHFNAGRGPIEQPKELKQHHNYFYPWKN
jgi:RHS repeat-associated protein